MKTNTEKIVTIFAGDTTFKVAAHAEVQLTALPDPNELVLAPQILMLLSQPEPERSGVPYSALND